MVRVFLKGGVWKNSEDEVLKAAVQKYGKQQWARVASLLNRKTAKQAKARWYEWLDPAIKKTEWSRVEEEKLLHLAKLLPAQWKTIGPIVGRTAAQCQEHYEHLLDQAASSAASGGKSDGGAESGDDVDGLRTSSLRAGQIDSHPETKPAKPDPIDMDEDELEMLQEARARLANTLGKKAKRKQREKMLAQAKRLADLQKRRELKAAGLLSSRALKKTRQRKNEIDLGVEIPFYKPAPIGFHDTATERVRTNQVQQQRLHQVDLHQINESRYRTRDLEEAKAKKREEKRLQVLEKVNATYQKEKEQQEEAMKMASASLRQRGPLQLPDPTVTDAEWNELAKQQQQVGDYGGDANLGSGPTLALLGDDRNRPLPTPMRTPFFASSSYASVGGGVGASSVMAGGAAVGAGAASTAAKSIKTAATSTSKRRDLVQEAAQLRKLERGTTPLLASALGGRDDYYGPGHDHEDDDDEDDEEGTRAVGGVNDDDEDRKMAATIGDGASVGASTWATSTHTIRELARQQRKAAKRARQELELALASLPEPQYEYELAGPSTTGHDDDDDDALGMATTVTDLDQADVEEAQREERRRHAEKKYQERSSVLKRPSLPRPIHPQGGGIADQHEGESGTAELLIQQEMIRMIRHDNHKFPPAASSDKHNKKKRKIQDDPSASSFMEEVVADPGQIALPVIPETNLELARQLIDAELEDLMGEKVKAILQGDDITASQVSSPEEAIAVLCDRAIAASRDSAKGMVFTESGWVETPTPEQTVASLRLEFDELRQATEDLRKKNVKVESKLNVVNGGYVKLAEKCTEEMRQVLEATKNATIEQAVYRMLQSQERVGGASRIEKLQDDVKRLQSMEAELQKQYGDLMVERRRQTVLANASVRQS